MSAASAEVEIRCPVGPKALLMKIRASGDSPAIASGNLMELVCRDCARTARRKDPLVLRVLHRYAFDGNLVESVVVRK